MADNNNYRRAPLLLEQDGRFTRLEQDEEDAAMGAAGAPVHEHTHALLGEADRHPASALAGPLQALKASVKALAEVAANQRDTDDWVVGQSMKLKSWLTSDEAGLLDAVITIKVEARPHKEEAEG